MSRRSGGAVFTVAMLGILIFASSKLVELNSVDRMKSDAATFWKSVGFPRIEPIDAIPKIERLALVAVMPSYEPYDGILVLVVDQKGHYDTRMIGCGQKEVSLLSFVGEKVPAGITLVFQPSRWGTSSFTLGVLAHRPTNEPNPEN